MLGWDITAAERLGPSVSNDNQLNWNDVQNTNLQLPTLSSSLSSNKLNFCTEIEMKDTILLRACKNTPGQALKVVHFIVTIASSIMLNPKFQKAVN